MSKNQIDNKKEIIMNEQKFKKKLSSNKINTKVIFQNKTDIKTNKINSIKENNNNNQVFKKINLKIASHFISNPNIINLLKIKPSNKLEANNTIKAIKYSISNKDKTYIPNKNKLNLKNIKPFATITEPTTNIKSNNKYKIINKSQSKKENPFNLNIFEQPVDPMTLEMEKFKKMRMGEKTYIKKNLGFKRKIKSSNKIPKINNKNLNDFRKSENLGDKLNVYIKTEEEDPKENQNYFKSYVKNININKGRIIENEKNVSKLVNNTKSYSNSYSINNKNLYADSDISNTNRQSIREYELSNDNNVQENLRDRAKKITKEKEALKKALTSKINSPLDSIQKNIIQKRTKSKIKSIEFKEKKTKNKLDKKRFSTDIDFIKTYETIQIRNSRQKKKIFPIKTFQRNFKKKLKINNKKNQSFGYINSKNNDIIKKKFEILLKIINSKIRLNIKLFLLKLKQYNIKNIKNEANLTQEENNKSEELNFKEKEKEKKNKLN